ncbi:MAG TPA: urea carboxylase-associated family protein [Woeseiaceae bacterium]
MNNKVTTVRIPACSAQTVELGIGDELVLIDPEGQQVSDVVAFALPDNKEYLSSGRSLDYAGRLWLTSGDILYSNRSRPMFTILEDTCGRHDFTLTPCSKDTFRILYEEIEERPGCEGNLAAALAPYDIGVDRVPIAFNVFMNVAVDVTSGEFRVLPPLSKAGDFVRLRAEMPLVVAMTACSAGQSNNFSFKPIDFQIARCPLIEGSAIPPPLG